MATVRLRFPDSDRERITSESAVQRYLDAGWVLVDEGNQEPAEEAGAADTTDEESPQGAE